MGRDAFGKTVFPVKVCAYVCTYGHMCVPRTFTNTNGRIQQEWDPSQRLYAILVTPSLHYCMGGLKINERARVLREGLGAGLIKGLLAAGEVTGGVHGGNRLGKGCAYGGFGVYVCMIEYMTLNTSIDVSIYVYTFTYI